MRDARKSCVLAAIATQSLAGCFDSSPSAADMRKAIETAYGAQRQQMIAATGMRSLVDMTMPELRIESFERIGCKPAGENMFACSYKMAANGQPGGVAEARFVKSRAGWEVLS